MTDNVNFDHQELMFKALPLEMLRGKPSFKLVLKRIKLLRDKLLQSWLRLLSTHLKADRRLKAG